MVAVHVVAGSWCARRHREQLGRMGWNRKGALRRKAAVEAVFSVLFCLFAAL
jgi:hypothetical protein